MENESITDLRVIKTRQAIKKSFLDLLRQKSFSTITIKDIANHAMIGRGTFYLHYEDKYQLLDHLIDTELKKFSDIIQPKAYIHNDIVDDQTLLHYAQKAFVHLKEHDSFFQSMFLRDDIPAFRTKLQQHFLQKFNKEFKDLHITERIDELDREILLIFISSAVIGLIEWWVKNGTIQTPEQMAKKLQTLLTKGPIHTLGLHIQNKTT
ncbi:TetR/AcrR family transcriptional regulator [Bacillus chungangensis]|uniref:AcrR family transcriptional regulator n=1 Tax=Bacillus chungangensis TaxID=587633 RepID=A0ABT9WTV9_9BACI|nr:TetR/AcrR family transcriptional regulator [Bacillus chungangensis]MDQ0176611.1 AcrR family transcriptional regulator [Bacillus chungangensis]